MFDNIEIDCKNHLPSLDIGLSFLHRVKQSWMPALVRPCKVGFDETWSETGIKIHQKPTDCDKAYSCCFAGTVLFVMKNITEKNITSRTEGPDILQHRIPNVIKMSKVLFCWNVSIM